MSDLSLTSAHAPPKEQGGLHPDFWIALLFLAGSVWLALPAIKGGVFDALSTDDAMRLVEVRDLIGGQGWFDLFQHRMDPPGGTSMHWSRLIDAPLAALILLLKPLVGMHSTEAVTLYVWPALLFAVALALVAAIARQMTNSFIPVIPAVVLAVLCLPALVHFRPGAIDHHNAQIDLLLAMILLAAQIESNVVKAALCGLTGSLSLAIGIEMLPAIGAVGVAVFGLFVWRGAPVARQAGAFGAGLAASSLLLAPALLPSSSWTTQACDAFGAPVVLLTAGGGISLLLMVGIDRYFRTLLMRIVSAAALATVLIGAFLVLFSGCIAPPFAHLDPIVITLWVNNIAEAISLPRMLQLFPEKVPGYYVFPVLTLGFAVLALIRSAASERFRWSVGIAPLAALIGFSLFQMRGAAAASMVAAPLFAASLAVLWPKFASVRNLVILSAIVSPFSLALAGLSAKPLMDVIFKPEPIGGLSPCQTLSDVASLKELPKGRVMAPVDLGPAILVETNHEVFAGPYHRNNDGMTALIRLMLAPPPAARQILSDRHVDYVVTCSATPDANIIKLAPEGLEARLARGDPPDFLERLHLDPNDKIAVWRVRK
ncbi:hypothetical protein [Bradyrhizobium erythrophlei]|jgi:hypothetical protein|uniref:4-amino-4-deoxy-L-arabinose transferase n=1 Tax=Bradyrhizobium erythrophlei TaxID=1437360 RepID=A0A1M7UK96_9BRAD|nr:hypothetical protein [Bradyrhizobium erythrophlei]SHN83453.1 hypothetical protein SAMN05444170_5510 [Bradyrhizobium erythrophlei]